jgi:hypothetical protein
LPNPQELSSRKRNGRREQEKTGIVECWKNGKQEEWNKWKGGRMGRPRNGRLEWWKNGKNRKTTKEWNNAMMEYWNNGMMKYWNRRNRENWILHSQVEKETLKLIGSLQKRQLLGDSEDTFDRE